MLDKLILKDAYEYHAEQGKQLWQLDQAESTRHWRMSMSCLCASNNFDYILTPTEYNHYLKIRKKYIGELSFPSTKTWLDFFIRIKFAWLLIRNKVTVVRTKD